jgi:hypothetical protein
MSKVNPLHIIIDSTHLKRDVNLNKEDMLYLKALSQNGFVKIHFPWIIYKECTTATTDNLKTELTTTITKLKGLTRKGFPENEGKVFEGISDALSAEVHKIEKLVNVVWGKYIKEAGAILHPFKAEHSKLVFDNYFSAGKPFKTLKSRNDIPDAFIYETVNEIATENEIHFISEDGNLIENLNGEKNITVHKDFKSLYDSASFKPIKEEYELIVKSESLKTELLSRKEEIIKSATKFITHIEPFEVTDLNVPSDNGDATINALDDPIIEIHEHEIKFIDNEFYVPISIVADASLDYFIYKPDYWTLREDRKVHVEDWNKHYFWAEDLVKINLKQTLTITAESIDPDSDFEIEFGELEDAEVQYDG